MQERYDYDINHIYIMVDPNEKEWIKLGEAKDLYGRLSGYNVGSRGKRCTFYETWDVPITFRDKDLHQKMRAISEDQDHEWFKVDPADASAMIDEVVDQVWLKHDPEHAMHIIDEHVMSDDEWATVEIDQLTPRACDAVLDRFKRAYC